MRSLIQITSKVPLDILIRYILGPIVLASGTSSKHCKVTYKISRKHQSQIKKNSGMDRVKTRISKLEVIHIHKKLVIHTQKVIAQKDYIMKENLRYV